MDCKRNYYLRSGTSVCSWSLNVGARGFYSLGWSLNLRGTVSARFAGQVDSVHLPKVAVKCNQNQLHGCKWLHKVPGRAQAAELLFP